MAVQDDISAKYLDQFNVSIPVSMVSKLRNWEARQKFQWDAVIKHPQQQFHGLKDFLKQMDMYSSTHIILKIAWKVIKTLVPKNTEILALMTSAPGLGSVGKSLLQIHGFGQVFGAHPEDLLRVDNIKSAVIDKAKGVISI
jgi:hypothetical protein